MNEQIFSNVFHKKLKSEVEKGYFEFIQDLRLDLNQGFSTDVVDIDFLDQLCDILNDETLNKYSPLKFYWLNLVDNIIYLIQLHEELLDDNDITTDELTELEDELLTFWNNSELAEPFLNFLNDGAPVVEASNSLLPLLENQIISFYVLHLNLYQQEFDDPLMYQTITELGDSETGFYISDDHRFVKLLKRPDTFPSLPICYIAPAENSIALELSNKPTKFKIENSPTPIKLEEINLFVLPCSQDTTTKITEFKKNISLALSNIKKAAPHLYSTFKSFTHTIIPINEAGIVSYSMQSLPGYSSINMFDRDQIDLMDDLLHENGHHYLNTYLNHIELINEDEDKIYFSPWRNALRSIRGIYHAVFTFYWALELFYNLDVASENKALHFSKDEKIKIKQRFIEEFYMLEYCQKDLTHAYQNKRITKDGLKLINMIYERISTYKSSTASVLKNLEILSASKHQEMLDLKSKLDKTRAHYKFV